MQHKQGTPVQCARPVKERKGSFASIKRKRKTRCQFGNYNKLLCELMALDNQSDKSIDFFHHSNSKKGKLVSIPPHTDQQKCVYKARNKNNR
jgi:hypothetical protein